ncbi:18781_t:CDS:2, partial [Gigaspora rosea]
MGMTEETQETPIEVSSEATTSQPENNNVVDWNRLRTSDLKAMCFKCGLRAKGSKTELVNRLEVFWRYEKRNGPPQQEDFNDQNDAFFAYIENKLEEKTNEKLASFPKKIFKRARDQYEYDSVCDAGSLLQKAIQEDSKEKVEEVQEQLRLRAFTLRVAEEEVEARKQAKSQEGYSTPYNRRNWQIKGRKFGSWGSKANYYTPYLLPHLYTKHRVSSLPATIVGVQVILHRFVPQDQQKAVIGEVDFFRTEPTMKVGDYTRVKKDKVKNKEITVMENIEQGREVVGKIHEPAAVSLLVKEPDPVIPKERMEFGREQGSKTLQDDNGSGKM